MRGVHGTVMLGRFIGTGAELLDPLLQYVHFAPSEEE